VRPSRLPAAVFGLWVAATALWWGFAFMPLPSAPPAWLSAAREACFGAAPTGLPEAQGWMLLVLAPASFLVAIAVLWGAELPAALGDVVRGWPGRAAAAALVALLALEASWVVAKLHAAQAVAGWAGDVHGAATELPRDYPRRTAAAPDLALVDQHGGTVSLAALRGRPVVVTFVFAHCQTLCPLVVESIKGAVPGPGAAEVLLVTLDPWRDTPSALPAMARQWALPGGYHVLSSRQVDDVLAVVRAWEVPFERDLRTGDVVHPGLVFLVDARGRLAYTFNNPPPAWLREGLRRL
jgi:protein SCO1/2